MDLYSTNTACALSTRKQITVQFHVDDLKVSHKEQSILEDFLGNLRSEFGQEDKLMENTGLLYEYLGITID